MSADTPTRAEPVVATVTEQTADVVEAADEKSNFEVFGLSGNAEKEKEYI
jgi:hypothetical protein